MWKWSHLIHLMGNVCGKFLSSIPLTLAVCAHATLLTSGNPALNYHSSQSSSCSSDPASLQAGLLWGLSFLRQEGWVWPSLTLILVQHLVSISLQSEPRAPWTVTAAAPRATLNYLDPTHKHTSSEGNEAEHYVMHIQELKQSLGVSSKFYSVFSVFLKYSQYKSVTADLHQCNLVK